MFILKQVNRPSYFRDIISPARNFNFIFANYFINLFFVFIQASVLFLIGRSLSVLSFEVLLTFAIGIFLSSSIFILIGMSLGYLIKSQNLSMLIAIFLVMFFLIMSDLLAPSILASSFIRFIISLNPFVLLNEILADSFILERPLISLIPSLTLLAYWLCGLIIAVYLSKRISIKNAIQ